LTHFLLAKPRSIPLRLKNAFGACSGNAPTHRLRPETKHKPYFQEQICLGRIDGRGFAC
jgi:hypothetical protein